MKRNKNHNNKRAYPFNAALALNFFLVACLFVTSPLISTAYGQSGADGKALFKAGEAALKAGQSKRAIRRLSQAIDAGTLSKIELAKAFYRRGMAYRQSGKLTEAIADLTNALYFKSLSPSDQAEALLERARAYQVLGLQSQASADLQSASQAKPAGIKTSSSIEIKNNVPLRGPLDGAQKTALAATGQVTSILPKNQLKSAATPANWKTAVETPQAQVAPGLGAQNASSQISGALSNGAGVVANGLSEIGTGVGSFLQGLFQGAAPETPGPQIATALPVWQTSTKAGSHKEAGKAAPQPEIPKVWTAVERRPVSSGGPKTAQKERHQRGPYHLQLVSLKTKDQARQAWKRLSLRHGELLIGQRPVFQKADLPNLGQRYRVRIGPFSDRSEPTELCNNLKAEGLDCLLVVP